MLEVIATHNMAPNELADAIAFCGSASRGEAYKVGWIPLAAYTGATKQQRLLICYNNVEKVGFVLWNASYGDIAIYQIWVRPDARLILHGRALVDELQKIGAQRNARLIRLWCAEDLAANLFWRQIGFEEKGWRHGPKRTSTRRHLLWTQLIIPSVSSKLAQSGLPLPTSRAAPRPPLFLPAPNSVGHRA